MAHYHVIERMSGHQTASFELKNGNNFLNYEKCKGTWKKILEEKAFIKMEMDVPSETSSVKVLLDIIENYIVLLYNTEKGIENDLDDIRKEEQDLLAKLECAIQYNIHVIQKFSSVEFKEEFFSTDNKKCAVIFANLYEVTRSLSNSKTFNLKNYLRETLICLHDILEEELKWLGKKTISVEENVVNEDADINKNDIRTLLRSKRFAPLLLPLLGIGLSIAGIGFSIGDLIRSIYSDKKVEQNFQHLFSQIDRNYNAINKNYNAIKSVEEKVDRNFVALKLVSELVNKTLATVEQMRLEMHQRFNDVLESIKDLKIGPTISKLNDFVEYFESERERIKNLPQNKYVTKLNEQNGILLYLKDCRTPKGNSLRTLLNEIIKQGYAVPQGDNDKTAFNALHALYYGTETYVSVMFFLLEQYSYLADYHYENEDVEEYNKYFDLIQGSFHEFKHSLIGDGSKESLIEEVISILRTVQSRNFIGSEREVLPQKMESLNQIKHQLEEMKLPLIEDIPGTLLGKPNFEKNGINTPIGEWKNDTKVFYALQYKINDIYSKVGEWSIPFTVHEKANPFLTIPVDTHRRTRLIFRKFNNDKPELVGVIEDKYQTKFRDIDRDLYNAASSLNGENIAIQEADTLIRNGANVNVVFYKGRRAIHAAAQGGNSQLALRFLISNNATNINVKDKNGYTPIYIAAEAAHDDFIELLMKHGADINARINSGCLTPLHIAAYKGYVSTVETLMKSNEIDVNAKDEENFTPLHSGVFGGVPVVNALTSNNTTDINAKSKEGLTPLHLASINNYHDVAEALLKSNRLGINVGAKGNLTALHFASMLGHLEMVNFLTAQNENDVNKESINNFAALHYAVARKKREVVLELLKINDTNVSVRGEGNITPLHIAATTSQEGVVLDLLEKEAAIEEQTTDKLTALHLAVMHGNMETISTLSDHGANVQARTTNGTTPLHLAAANGKLDIVKFLIEKKGADFNAKDYYSKTPLYLATLNDHLTVVKYLIDEKSVSSGDIIFTAAENGYLDIIEYLVEKGASLNLKKSFEDLLLTAIRCGQLNIVKYVVEKGTGINVKNNEGDTPLHIAARYYQLDVVKYLVEKGAALNVKGNYGRTPLHTTISYPELNLKIYLVENETGLNVTNTNNETSADSQLAIVKYLVKKAADLNVQDNFGCTPLHTAALYRHLNIFKFLVENGAHLNTGNINGETPLYTAAQYGQFNIVKYIIDEKNIDPNNTKTNWGNPLHAAVSSGNLRLVRYLVDEKNVNANTKTYFGQIPLHFAIHGLHGMSLDGHSLGILKYLVEEKKGDINFKNNDGDTPLYQAVSYDSFNAVKYLVEKGADLNIRNNQGDSFLYRAARSGRLAIVMYLVEEKGADVNDRNNLHETPLLTAAEFGALDVVKYLVEKGANVNAITNNGDNSLHKAASGYRTLDTLRYLVDKGVDLNVKNKNGKTALDLANESIYRSTSSEKVSFLHFALSNRNHVRHRRHEQHDRGQEGVSFSSIYARKYRSIAKPESLQNEKVGFNIPNAASGASNSLSWINHFANTVASIFKNVSDFIFSPYKLSNITAEHCQPSKTLTTQCVDINSTLFLLDVFARKITGQKYISTADRPMASLEARCYALNITREFEKVFKDTAKRLGISIKQLDPIKILGAIERKIISGELFKIPTILCSAAREACPQNEKFLNILKGNIENILDEQLLGNKEQSNNQTQSIAISNNKMSYLDKIAIGGDASNFNYKFYGVNKKIFTTFERCELINPY